MNKIILVSEDSGESPCSKSSNRQLTPDYRLAGINLPGDAKKRGKDNPGVVHYDYN